MTQFEKLKKNILECSSPMELIGLLNGYDVASALFCKDNYPNEVSFNHGNIEDVSIYGKEAYLNSEIKL